MIDRAALVRLAGLVGIETRYTDALGQTREATDESLQAVIDAFGLPPDPALAAVELEESERALPLGLAPVQILHAEDSHPVLSLHLPAGTRAIQWECRLENGERRTGSAAADRRARSYAFVLPLPAGLPHGYHQLQIEAGGVVAQTELIVAPLSCHLPPQLGPGGRRWGLTCQLYGLRSEHNWGLGDLSDLASLARLAGSFGAAVLGVNPLHARFAAEPLHVSPYSPSSRIRLDYLYIDLLAVPGFAADDATRDLVRGEWFGATRDAARSAQLIDYGAVAACKRPVLEALWRRFCALDLGDGEAARTAPGQAFREFQRDGGRSLLDFATFEALHEHHCRERRGFSWRNWPAPMRNPRSPEVAAFAAAHRNRIEFFQFLQWEAERQLAAAAAAGREGGLSIGLYRDFAVGANPNGADAWSDQELVVPRASIGAPPDILSRTGQNWGLAPINPMVLRRQRFAPFVASLRANIRHAGVLRIDHVMALKRLYWIPSGMAANAGCYVNYPFDDLLRLVALESCRERCAVVGEDLGTVPQGFRETMRSANVLSYRILGFERQAHGRFIPPADYPPLAAASVATHDLPTLAGFWLGCDIAWRRRLGLYPDAQADAADTDQRSRDRRQLLEALAREGLLAAEDFARFFSANGEPVYTPELRDAIQAYLARSRARLMLVQLEDVVGESEQANLPGTTDAHPNWRRRLGRTLEEIIGGPELPRIARAVEQAPARGRSMSEARDTTAPIRATYRLQFHRGFTFRDATALVPYLAALGVSHLYASPITEARPGSTHGYDIIDHNRLNPEIGSDADFRELSAGLRAHGMGLIVDFVPNHMGIGADNAWWLDVLEWGQESPFARYFDINWHPLRADLEGRVLLPVLGEQYGVILEKGEIELRFNPAEGSFSAWYFEHRFPIAPRTYPMILDAGGEVLAGLAHDFAVIANLPPIAARERAVELKRCLADAAREAAVSGAITSALQRFSGQSGDRDSFGPLHRLLEAQSYRIADWRVAAEEINYRRFFNINDLAGLRMELPELFEETHRLMLGLIERGALHGLRIDHIDGLFDPREYCERLQQSCGTPLYVLVEKILARYEILPAWPVAGTTGYDFVNQVLAIFVDPAGEAAMTRLYRRLAPRDGNFDDVLDACKRRIMRVNLASEMNVIAREFHQLAMRDWRTRDFTLNGVLAALEEVVAAFPVYRTYVSPRGSDAEDFRYIGWAIGQARKRWRGADTSIFDFLRAVLTGEAAEPERDPSPGGALYTAMHFQQLTGPVMAKAAEDTAFYRYVRLLALNEVGGDPRRFGMSVAAFHHLAQQRARQWPQAMVTTATHDTKRGEDARARLALLSEMPREWGRRVFQWLRLNRSRRSQIDGETVPDRNVEYLFYQALFGAWPAALEPSDRLGIESLVERIEAYMIKAVRERKLETSWSNPNPEYEAALQRFVRGALNASRPNPFLAEFHAFVVALAREGAITSLAQLVLKLTVPGVPDIYQGGELWDFSLVDPDNRRPVDWDTRRALLEATSAMRPSDLVDGWQDGREKLFATRCLLALRRAHPALFAAGDYQPLETEGDRSVHLCAFSRSHKGAGLVVAVPRLVHQLFHGGDIADWGAATLALPPGGGWRDIFTRRRLDRCDRVPATELLIDFPVSVLIGDSDVADT